MPDLALSHPISPLGLRSRWQAWWLLRQPCSDTQQLTQRNVYILPTRAGWMLAVTLVLMLVGSINYQLNLGYLLTFLVAGSTTIAMHLTHGNLRQLQCSLRPGLPVFVGQAATVQLSLHNPGRRMRHAIGLRWRGQGSRADSADLIDIEGQGTRVVAMAFDTLRRGRQGIPAIEIETRFPLGTFRAWTWMRPAATVLVYPTPEPSPPPLPGSPPAWEGGRSSATPSGQDEMPDGVRPWRRGDPLKWVVWKKIARNWTGGSDRWISREFDSLSSGDLWLSIEATGFNDTEAALSRLCAWVLLAENAGQRYGLVLPHSRIEPDGGTAHQQRCLEALALC